MYTKLLLLFRCFTIETRHLFYFLLFSHSFVCFGSRDSHCSLIPFLMFGLLVHDATEAHATTHHTSFFVLVAVALLLLIYWARVCEFGVFFSRSICLCDSRCFDFDAAINDVLCSFHLRPLKIHRSIPKFHLPDAYTSGVDAIFFPPSSGNGYAVTSVKKNRPVFRFRSLFVPNANNRAGKK